MKQSKMSAAEIRRRALRAAGQVALWSTLACGGTAPTGALSEGPAEGPEEQAPVPVAEVVADPLAPEVIALVATATAPLPEVCEYLEGEDPEQGWRDYLACCERIGWDWDRGCAAWGPPVPPALEVA